MLNESPHLLFSHFSLPTSHFSFDSSLRPTRRGVYSFGHVLVYASTRLGLVERRYRCAAPCDVSVYPSFQRLHQYELMAISQNLQEPGNK